jgi:hypothetical protein
LSRIALLVAALLCSGSGRAQESAPASRHGVLTRAEAEADLDVLEAAIRDQWSYLEDKEKNGGLDLAELVAAAKARLEDVNTKAQFHGNVLELVASLKDGHANVFTLGVAQPQRRWPFRVEETADGFVVVANAAGRPDLGDRVVGVVPAGRARTTIEEELARIERRTLASSDGARRRAALRTLHETDARLVAVQMKGNHGVYSFTFDTVEDAKAPASPADERRREKAWTPSIVAPGVAKFCVRTFAVEDWTGWLAAKPESREAFLTKTKESIDRCFAELRKLEPRALVLDLRGNGGGTDLLGIHLAKHLLPKRFVYFMLSSKQFGGWRKPHGYEHDPLPPERRFDGPLAILVDEDCFSVTDNCLRAIVENRDDVIVVGRPTNGGTGAPRVVAKLPASETSVTLCTMRVYGPKGGMIEGRGTKPTIPVRWTAADYLEKRDPDVAAALEALRRVIAR